MASHPPSTEPADPTSAEPAAHISDVTTAKTCDVATETSTMTSAEASAMASTEAAPASRLCAGHGQSTDEDHSRQNLHPPIQHGILLLHAATHPPYCVDVVTVDATENPV